MRAHLLACLFYLGSFLLNGGTAGAAGFGQNPAMPAYGLFPANQFVVTSGGCRDCTALPQALWYFRDETIAVPKRACRSPDSNRRCRCGKTSLPGRR